MQFFITGSAGFTGFATAQYLLQQGHDVMGLCRNETQAKHLQAAGVQPVLGTLETLADTVISNVDVVLHCAALLGKWAPYSDYEKVNVQGTKAAVEKAMAIGAKRFIHISTDMVLMNDKDIWNATEAMPFGNAPYPYAKSKRKAEELLQGYRSEIEIVILRPRMIWGNRHSPLYKTMQQAAASGRFLWLNHGRAQTSVTHVLNLAAAIALVAQHPAAVGQVFHVADQQTHSLYNFWQQQLATQQCHLPDISIPGWLARLIAHCIEPIWIISGFKKAPPITRMAAVSFSRSCTLNTDKITYELGYSPIISFEEGLRQMRHY